MTTIEALRRPIERTFAPVGDDGLTDAERAERAARYGATAASTAVSDADRAAIEFIRARRVERG